jgi:hypothetical protein
MVDIGDLSFSLEREDNRQWRVDAKRQKDCLCTNLDGDPETRAAKRALDGAPFEAGDVPARLAGDQKVKP